MGSGMPFASGLVPSPRPFAGAPEPLHKASWLTHYLTEDGFYTDEERPVVDQAGPKQKQKVLKKIPQKVIQNAVGLAIFTTMRSGLWFSGAGGSGILVARKEDGSWSPPSGILLHTAGLGFLVGIDIYDCVVVINNPKALQSFTKIRATLGGEISAVAGPVGVGGVLENDGKWKQANRPVFTYLKSRGFYAGVQVDGSIIIERTDENERFYGEKIGVADILAGKVRHPPLELNMLMETLKAAEGRTDVDSQLIDQLEGQPAPADMDIEPPTDPGFGVPDPEDPDPYGILALQKEGLQIKEAGASAAPATPQKRPVPPLPPRASGSVMIQKQSEQEDVQQLSGASQAEEVDSQHKPLVLEDNEPPAEASTLTEAESSAKHVDESPAEASTLTEAESPVKHVDDIPAETVHESPAKPEDESLAKTEDESSTKPSTAEEKEVVAVEPTPESHA